MDPNDNAYLKANKGLVSGSDTLEVAEYVCEGIKNCGNFLSCNAQMDSLKILVKRALLPKDPSRINELLEREAIGHIARLIAKHFTTKSGTQERRRSVLTYNFDNLVEYCLSKQNPQINAQSIYDKAKPDPSYQAHIYHPHGFLEVMGKDGWGSGKQESKPSDGHQCPECGEKLSFEGGCNVCKSCGWSKCE